MLAIRGFLSGSSRVVRNCALFFDCTSQMMYFRPSSLSMSSGEYSGGSLFFAGSISLRTHGKSVLVTCKARKCAPSSPQCARRSGRCSAFMPRRIGIRTIGDVLQRKMRTSSSSPPIATSTVGSWSTFSRAAPAPGRPFGSKTVSSWRPKKILLHVNVDVNLASNLSSITSRPTSSPVFQRVKWCGAGTSGVAGTAESACGVVASPVSTNALVELELDAGAAAAPGDVTDAPPSGETAGASTKHGVCAVQDVPLGYLRGLWRMMSLSHQRLLRLAPLSPTQPHSAPHAGI